MEHAVTDHKGGEHDEEQNEQVEHDRRTRFLEVVLAEEGQVGGQDGYHNEDVHYLAEDGQTEDALLVLLPSLRLFHVRHQNVVGALIDDFSPVDDLLSALYDTAGQGDAVVQFVQTGFAPFLVIGQVGGYVVVEVAFT